MNAGQMISMLTVAVSAHDAIKRLAGAEVDKAAAALTAIRVIEHQLEQGFAGKLEPQTVLARIELLESALAKNNAAALEALAKKFGK